MFKIIVVFWFLRFFTNLFTNNTTFRHFYKSYLESLEKHNIKEAKDIDNISKEAKVDIVVKMLYILLITGFKLFMIVIDFIIMLNMLKYDSTLITTLFIILTLIDVFISLIKAKFVKNKKDNLIESTRKSLCKLERFSIYGFICRVLNVLYWGYVIYLLFF